MPRLDCFFQMDGRRHTEGRQKHRQTVFCCAGSKRERQRALLPIFSLESEYKKLDLFIVLILLQTFDLCSHLLESQKMEKAQNLKHRMVNKCLTLGKRINLVKEMNFKFQKCVHDNWRTDYTTKALPPSQLEYTSKMRDIETEAEQTNVDLDKLENDLAEFLSFLLKNSLVEMEKLIVRVNK